MTADTMHELQRLKLHRGSVKAVRLAPVIGYV
jgi:hypothetical protein